MVYKAVQKATKRQVALKFVSIDVTPESSARFRREAELAASLNHPNVAQIYGVDDEDPS